MIINAVKCEVCVRQFPIDPMAGPPEMYLPPEWLVLFQGELHNQHSWHGWHFCSIKCLQEWLSDRVNDIHLS